MGRLSLNHRMAHYRIKNQSLAQLGKRKIDWAEEHMPVLASLGDKYRLEKPLEGIRICGCLHVTKETGVLIRTLRSSGAELSWCGCNPLSTRMTLPPQLQLTKEFQFMLVKGSPQINTMKIYTAQWKLSLISQ